MSSAVTVSGFTQFDPSKLFSCGDISIKFSLDGSISYFAYKGVSTCAMVACYSLVDVLMF